MRRGNVLYVGKLNDNDEIFVAEEMIYQSIAHSWGEHL